MDPRQISKFMHGVELDKNGLVMNIMQESRCCLDREFDPRTDLEIADPELGGFQLNHQDVFSTLISGSHESLEELMTELFFHKEDAHVEMKHLEKADPEGISPNDLHKCAKTAMTEHFRSTKPSMDEKKATCDQLVSRGLALAAIPTAIRACTQSSRRMKC